MAVLHQDRSHCRLRQLFEVRRHKKAPNSATAAPRWPLPEMLLSERLLPKRPGLPEINAPAVPSAPSVLSALSIVPALLVLFGLCLTAAPAAAHGVYIFAWPDRFEGGSGICTESYFSGKSKVQDGEVTMTDATGSVLGGTRTNEKGIACLPLPEKPSDLVFAVQAGEGHRAEFRISAADLALPPASPKSAGTVDHKTTGTTSSSASLPVQAGTDKSIGTTIDQPAAPDTQLTEQALRTVFREELQTQLSPIRKALAERDAGLPSAREIFGGIGWILGLAGLGGWWAARRTRR